MMEKIKFIISALLLSVLFARAELTVSDTWVSDDFNRSVGASSQGSMGTDIWMNGFSEGSQWGIADNEAFASLGKGAVGLLVNKAVKLGREFTLCVDVKTLSDNRWAGLLFNYKDENHYSYFRFKSGTGNWAVQRVVNGVQHRIGATGRLNAGVFKSNMLSSTPDRLDLKITETQRPG